MEKEAKMIYLFLLLVSLLLVSTMMGYAYSVEFDRIVFGEGQPTHNLMSVGYWKSKNEKRKCLILYHIWNGVIIGEFLLIIYFVWNG